MRDIIDIVKILHEGEAVKNSNSRALALIKIAAKKFTRAKLSGGNCGTFALALGRKLKEEGFDPKLGFIYRAEVNQEYKEGKWLQTRKHFDNIKEVLAAETDIYHVFLMLDGGFYDATGKTTVDEIFKIAEIQYRDYEAGDFSDIDIDDPPMITLIENDTAWSITANQFYAAMS